MPTAAEQAESSLTSAIANAVKAGSEELARLDDVVAEADSRLRDARQALSDGASDQTEEDNGFYVILEAVVDDLKSRLDERRTVGSTFNLVFFGRTGAGKSTLLSTLGGLDGELVSDGRSDFTTDIRVLDWNGCRLYDTPGINGWGRTRSRADLEKTARETVQVADVVLLCFDSQGPQASEFGKVAEWVRAYGKPVIAVLNIRNPMWRHPARESSAAQRKGWSGTAQHHADTIASELEAIGLPGVPIVAINSRRALFARASVPFVGPAGVEFEQERAKHGIDYLNRWSNLPLLEELISACILEGAGDLRLAALREDFRARLLELVDEVNRIAEFEQQRAVVVEDTVAAWLSNIGYPEPPPDGTDLLRQLEASRGEPFTAPVTGRLESHSRHLLRTHLYPLRAKSHRAAEALILDAFDEKREVKSAEFESCVFDQSSLYKAINGVANTASEFLTSSLGTTAVDARIDLELIDRTAASIRGSAGRVHRWGANLLRGVGLLAGAGSAALGIVALTSFWNPVGWVAAVLFAGTGIVSAVASFIGRKAKHGAETRRVAARAIAVAEARSTVNSYYDACESQQLAKLLTKCWESARPKLDELLKDALRRRVGCATLLSEARWLRDQAGDQPPSKTPTEVIRLAGDRLFAQVREWDPPTLNALLLGEDWLQSTVESFAPAALLPQDIGRYALSAEESRSAFDTFLRDGTRQPDADRVRTWIGRVSATETLNPHERVELDAAQRLMDAAPKVVMLGDYSSGKSSLIKRLLTDAGVETPLGLDVAGGRATSAVSQYAFGPLVLIDAPGFQSDQDDHDLAALGAGHDAALVIVVLHVNLLIGDSSRLEALLLGDEARVGKAASTVYVIGRIDEIGADPHSSGADFLRRKRRKVEELLSILASRGIPVEAARVMPLSADPYGLVGDRTPVTDADYSTTNRVWDGVSALSAPLLALDDDVLLGLSAGAALDRARSAVLAIGRRLRADIAGIEQAFEISSRLDQLVDTSLVELRLLIRSTERRVRRVVDDHANEMLAEALGAVPSEVVAISKRLESWWEDPRLGSALQSVQSSIDRDVNDWWKRHSSELDRELRRIEFSMNRGGPPSADGNVAANLQAGFGVVAGVMRGAHGLGKALGNRDAVYAIGKALQLKFKPWGAVKLGAKLGKAAAILGVVALAFDIAEFVNDQVQQERREQARKSAVEHIRSTADLVIGDLLTQQDGPIDYLAQCERAFLEQLSQLRDESEVQQQLARAASLSLGKIVMFEGVGNDLAEASTERTIA